MALPVFLSKTERKDDFSKGPPYLLPQKTNTGPFPFSGTYSYSLEDRRKTKRNKCGETSEVSEPLQSSLIPVGA
jgi:hypothetical protein